MSRRKQSNPKPIKHDEEEEGMDTSEEKAPVNTNVNDQETGTESPPESKIPSTDDESHGPRDSVDVYDGYQSSPSKSEHWLNEKALSETSDHDKNGTDEPGHETENSSRNESSLMPSGEMNLSLKPKNICMEKDNEEKTKDDANNDKDGVNNENYELQNKIQIHLNREPSLSPVMENLSGSEGSSTNVQHATFRFKRSSKSRRRNRSRSRSSSKSLGVSSSPDPLLSNSNQSREEAERALVNQLQLPSDVLYLRQQEMNIHGTASVGWVVCCAIPLPQGSSLGPFQGQLVPPEAVKVGDLIVQFTNKKGKQALMNVAGQSGGWLALLRSAKLTTERNTHVYWEGGRIWCEIISDIEIGTELRATFSFQNDDDVEDNGDDESLDAPEVKDTEGQSTEETGGSVQHSHHAFQQQIAPGHAALIYGCPFCGVRFSSPRTLQGHLSFYCSKKTTSDQIVAPAGKERDKGSNHQVLPEGPTVKQEPGLSQDFQAAKQQASEANSRSDSADLQSPQAKSGPTGQVFKCKHCSYKADKLSSLNRHMRMHNNDKIKMTNLLADVGPACSNSSEQAVNVKSPSSETFCNECRIQFSNLHTYKCHKEHYCAQRRKKALADPSAFAAMFHSPFSFHDAAKVGIPSALHMAALNQGGLILPGAAGDSAGTATVLLSAPVLTPSGMANIAISVPTILMQPIVTEQDVGATLASPRAKKSPEKHQSSSSQHSPHALPLAHYLNLPTTTTTAGYTRALEELNKLKEFSSIKTNSIQEDHPLDLTTTKKEIKFESERCTEDVPTNSTFLQSDVAVDARRTIHKPSQPSSTSDDSNPPSSPVSQRTSKKELDLPPSQVIRSEHLTPNSMLVQVLPHPSILIPPASFMTASLPVSPPSMHAAPASPSSKPNGISKCADCNIVFYKHDNYLIHKKHYCSAKRRVSTHSTYTTESTPLVVETDSKPQTVTQHPPSPLSLQSPPLKIKKESEKEYAVSPKQSDISNTKHSGEVKYKFYCVPCRIKFSNSSILEAHKEYYCPAGKDSEQSVIVQTTSSEAAPVLSPRNDHEHTSPDSPQDEFTCTRCNSIFVSARLLRLHMCDGGFPCPHCDHVSITENRLAEHLKVHAPTKAYRCTICGYRGNTARGMRMHGKTHIDEGLDFTDENMLEYHEPALIPVVYSPHPGTATDTELLRLKNEPYKRRRSRKAYEKFDCPLPKVDIPQTCPICGQSFVGADFLMSHLKAHEKAASQYVSALMKCIHCSFIGKSIEDLCNHFEANHMSNHRSKKPRLSSSDTDEHSHHGRNSSSFWRTGKTESVENEDGVKVSKDKNKSSEESNSQLINSNQDSSSSKDDRIQETILQLPCTIKHEPMEEDEDPKAVSPNKFSHFLQTPSHSPELYSSCGPENRRLLSPLASSGGKGEMSNKDQEAEAGDNTCTRKQTSFQVHETEPGEINAINVKPEPRIEDSDSSPKHLQHSDDEMDAKEEVNDSSNDLKTEGLAHSGKTSSELQPQTSSRVSYRINSHTQEDKEFRRISPISKSHLPDQDKSPAKSSLHAPNFLISPPPHTDTNQNPASTNIRVSSSPSSFEEMTNVPTSSVTAVFPAHQIQAHTIPFPWSSPPIALPYLFLPPSQSGFSTTTPPSPCPRDERTGYCQNCDISFSKHSTYLAHKKYYCTAHPRGEAPSSAKA